MSGAVQLVLGEGGEGSYLYAIRRRVCNKCWILTSEGTYSYGAELCVVLCTDFICITSSA